MSASLLGVIARFVPATPLWLDEALSVNIAQHPVGSIDNLLRHDGHPPLYYYVLAGWMQVFGESDFAVRSLSMVLGLIALALAYVVARRHGGRELATMTAFVMAVSPYAIRYSSEARMYALVMVLVLCGWLAVTAAIARPNVWRLIPVSLVSGALLLTHYWAMFLIAALVLLLLVHGWFVPGERGPHRRVALAAIVGGVFFVPWLSSFLYQLRHTGTPWAAPARPTRVVSESLSEFSGGIDPEAVLFLALASVLLVIGVFGRRERNLLVLGRSNQPWITNAFAVVSVTIAIGAAATFIGRSAFAGRYAAIYFPFFVVFLGLGLIQLGHNWVRTIAIVLVALLSLAGVVEQLRRDRTQAGQIASLINAVAQPGDTVVICPDQLGPSLMRRLRSDITALSYPALDDPRLVDWVDYKERYAAANPAAVAQAVINRTAADRRIWIEYSSSYRAVGDQCDRLVEAVAAQRPRSQLLALPDGVRYLETAALRRFDP